MEAGSPGLLPSPLPSPAPSPVPSPRGFRKVLSNRSRTSLQDPGTGTGTAGETSGTQCPRPSADSTSTAREISPKNLSRTSSHDDSSKSGSSGIRKLIPGQAKRKRRRLREKAGLAQPESESAGTDSNPASVDGTNTNNTTITSSSNGPALVVRNHSATSLLQDDSSSLLTDDSEPSSARPPLLNHNSHTGYLTHSSPLINTTAVDDGTSVAQDQEKPTLSNQQPVRSPVLSTSSVPSITHSPSLPVTSSTPVLSSPTPLDRASTLAPPSASQPGRRKSISSSIRAISPTRKLRKALHAGASGKSSTISPDRHSLRDHDADVETAGLNANEGRPQTQTASLARSPNLAGTPTDPSDHWKISSPSLPSLAAQDRPTTPPSAGSNAPLTTVTPPTPVDSRAPTPKSPTRAPEPAAVKNEASGIFVSPSGNMISHRRIRSDSASLHHPSKLSNAIAAPLTPTIEEARTPSAKSESRNVTPNSGFFASWVSAAQNAANTLTSTLNTQNRSRSGTESTVPENSIPEESESDLTGAAGVESDLSKKQLAVETLGAGDLKLSHLGIGTESTQNGLSGPDLMAARKDMTIRSDEAAAKIEDMLAKRAVSAAYEKPSEDSSKTPVAELSDPINAPRHASTFNSNVSSDRQTTPNGSVIEGDTGSVKRNNSVRSRLKDRRHRASSNVTPTSTVGTLLAASTSSLANPAAGLRLTGFGVAPKVRNRTFHQLFRSVPEDDFLIEDYSCALQKEILLAGRIYISEGHICFSSNILGWVTTLVISFEEVMAIERETTAMVFPNAIAIQTLHARHTFRSLLSREATFDLMVGIWRQSHPAAFKKSIAGAQAQDETADKADKPVESELDSDEESDDGNESTDEDREEEGVGSVVEAGSLAGSDVADGAALVTRKVSAINAGAAGSMMTSPPAAGDGPATEKAVAAASAATVDFPGSTIHAPTDCTDSATHYDKPLKDESIPAPLGKIYSMLFGPTSGLFLTKYLVDEQKVTELQYEDDKKGLGEQIKSRTYSYIKPLYASIGPRQTKCITTENLDAFDLERSVSVTCTTQTPDVPSGNVFSVKTRYCLSWAAGNNTRLQMNCTVEWTGKSWLKGPIEKGATDGQQTYGNDLVKALKAAVSSRPRAATAGSKGLKAGKRRRKGEKNATTSPKSQIVTRENENWGLLEPFRGTFGPIVDLFRPFAWTVAVGTIVMLLCIISFRRSARGSVGVVDYPGYPGSARLAAYEELWQKEEGDLWSWLEDRVGVDGLALQGDLKHPNRPASRQAAKAKAQERQKILGGRNAEARLREEMMTEREMGEAIRVTQERLEVLKGVMEKKKMGRMSAKVAKEGSR